eukprot:TRINITY_DN7364_c0_g1_i1.p1 TRINITY_DN7364_c0_g1~~TRINITY_DN7364_c0_g1_i1.p1  ORF type:complete len:617 (+),score=163.27 TRINITY_DN7364_c0_g1_i1:71-1852(+)
MTCQPLSFWLMQEQSPNAATKGGLVESPHGNSVGESPNAATKGGLVESPHGGKSVGDEDLEFSDTLQMLIEMGQLGEAPRSAASENGKATETPSPSPKKPCEGSAGASKKPCEGSAEASPVQLPGKGDATASPGPKKPCEGSAGASPMQLPGKGDATASPGGVAGVDEVPTPVSKPVRRGRTLPATFLRSPELPLPGGVAAAEQRSPHGASLSAAGAAASAPPASGSEPLQVVVCGKTGCDKSGSPTPAAATAVGVPTLFLRAQSAADGAPRGQAAPSVLVAEATPPHPTETIGGSSSSKALPLGSAAQPPSGSAAAAVPGQRSKCEEAAVPPAASAARPVAAPSSPAAVSAGASVSLPESLAERARAAGLAWGTAELAKVSKAAEVQDTAATSAAAAGGGLGLAFADQGEIKRIRRQQAKEVKESSQPVTQKPTPKKQEAPEAARASEASASTAVADGSCGPKRRKLREAAVDCDAVPLQQPKRLRRAAAKEAADAREAAAAPAAPEKALLPAGLSACAADESVMEQLSSPGGPAAGRVQDPTLRVASQRPDAVPAAAHHRDPQERRASPEVWTEQQRALFKRIKQKMKRFE